MITHDSKLKKIRRVRLKLAQNISIPRLTVYRTNRHIWLQIIDDKKAKTIVSTSTKVLKTKGTKTELATAVGEEIAKLALLKKVKRVRFDRGLYKYHGRVKAVADAARKQGLIF